MRPADLERLTRTRRDAGTRANLAAARLAAAQDGTVPAAFLIGYESERLLDDLLDACDRLARNLYAGTDPDYETEPDYETLLRKLGDVEKAITERRAGSRRSRLSGLLSNTEGRTPEEAALFAAKALELRS